MPARQPAGAADRRSAVNRWLPVVLLALLGALTAMVFAVNQLAPVDTYLYFQTANAPHVYGTVWGAGSDSLFVYPPPFVYFVRLLSFGGWWSWLLIWTVILALSYGPLRWLGIVAIVVGFIGRSSAATIIPFAVPGAYLFIGNVQPLILVTVMLGLRYPAMWAIPLLTKIGPGIGILWFAVRGDWRSLGIALGTTAAIAGVSFLIDPGLWGDWLRFMVTNVSTPSPIPVVPIPGWVRFPIAIALIVWGARTDRAWTVPIACGIASFALYEWSYLTVWLGVFAYVGPWAPRDPDGRPSLAGPRLKDRPAPGAVPPPSTPSNGPAPSPTTA